MRYETITSGDERIGKKVFVLNTGEIGTIDRVYRFADGSESFHLNFGRENGYEGFERTGVEVRESGDESHGFQLLR